MSAKGDEKTSRRNMKGKTFRQSYGIKKKFIQQKSYILSLHLKQERRLRF